LYTGISGNHAHHYKDVFYSEHANRWNTGDHVATPMNVGSKGGVDTDNVGYQMDRNTFNAGNHQHLVKGLTSNSHASLAYTGGNQPFDNRPAFTVVQYIIYIQN
jgi:microcystin-dependent protein